MSEIGSKLAALIRHVDLVSESCDVSELSRYVLTGEFRDEEFEPEVYVTSFQLLRSTFEVSQSLLTAQVFDRLALVRAVCQAVIVSDEFEELIAIEYIPADLFGIITNKSAAGKFNEDDAVRESVFIESILTLLYSKFKSLRSRFRKELGRFLKEFVMIPTRVSHLTPILNVLNLILSGSPYVDHSLFRSILLPLHAPNGWALWDRQAPILGEYHKALVRCCYTVVEKDRINLATELVDYLLTSAFPPIHHANTAKELLILFEIGKFLDMCDMSRLKSKLFKKIIEEISSENAQVIQSVLLYWKSPPMAFGKNIKPFLREYMEPLVVALYRGNGEPHWNPTVNRMTSLVLKSLEDCDGELFAQAANACTRSVEDTRPLVTGTVGRIRDPYSMAVPEVSSNPPLSTTGVAPYICSSDTYVSKARSREDAHSTGMERMRLYMSRLIPAELSSEKAAVTPWLAALSSETPTLLPDLKFHNLVFGRDLGVGAFSVVRYARVIRPKVYLSQWDEVAVKIVSYGVVNRLNYGANVTREVCCLRRLSHPSIARLISSFRWRDGIYLVLEYGMYGDLHSYLLHRRRETNVEGLDVDSARILIGEVSNALSVVHESGFVYSDVKPENILITANKHVKLADFGACRPVSDSAKLLLKESRDALSCMRSGDWKELPLEARAVELSDEDILRPKSFEGTLTYMAPELTEQSEPTVLTDAWALGVTMYFVLKGRLPPWTALLRNDRQEQQGPHSAISQLSFDTIRIIQDDLRMVCMVEENQTNQTALHSFLSSLLSVDPVHRSSVVEILDHEFFQIIQDVTTLYKRNLDELHGSYLPHLQEAGGANYVGGSACGEASPQWEKRQLSKIWTAQPKDFALTATTGSVGNGAGAIVETDAEKYAPFM